MLLNFIVIVQEPWKASVSEVNQITPRDGTEPRALDVNKKIGFCQTLEQRLPIIVSDRHDDAVVCKLGKN